MSKVVNVIIDKVLPQKIFLFGSRATNKADEKSDYDIFLYYLLAREGFGIPVDLLVDAEERFERLKGNRYLIYHEVEKTGRRSMKMTTTRKPTHPGEVLLEDVLKPLGLTITEAAQDLGVNRKTLSAMVKGKCSLTTEMAIRIAHATGTSPESWLNMQTKFNRNQRC